jgi:hypothetical protein
MVTARRIACAVAVLCWQGGCGIEGLLYDTVASTRHPPPPAPPAPTVLQGIIGGDQAFRDEVVQKRALKLVDASGAEVAPGALAFGVDEGRTTFRAELPPGSEPNHLRAVATVRAANLKAVAPRLVAGEARALFAPIDAESTAAALVAEALAKKARVSLASAPPSALDPMLAEGGAIAARVKPPAKLTELVGALAAFAAAAPESSPPLFADAALADDALAAIAIDLDGDSFQDEPAEVKRRFDDALDEAAQDLVLRVCPREDAVRLVIACAFADAVDANGNAIDRYKWLDPKEVANDQRRMFIAAGLHPESPLQSTEVHQSLGAWVPNAVAMYDDGTHGDERARDSVWTVTFDLPPGARIGYKFTWGVQGANWTGTEEWPGNQRILDVRDLDGDLIVARKDAFGDETTNKDKTNTRAFARGGTGTVTWTTDADGDGVIDAGEGDYVGGVRRAWSPAVEALVGECPL